MVAAPDPVNPRLAGRPALSEGPAFLDQAGDLSSLAAALEEAARLSPAQGITYLEADGAQTFQSYPQLVAEARCIQQGLHARGIRPQDKVLFQFTENRDFIAGFWGCVFAGCVPVPLAVPAGYDRPDSALSKLKNVGAMFAQPRVLTNARLAPALREAALQLGFAPDSILEIAPLRTHSPAAAPHPTELDDLVLLLLTSGSTGQPKGVTLTHRNLLARSAGTAQANGFSAADISLNWMPLDHVGGLVMYHVQDVFNRCSQIQASTELILRRPLQWLDWIDQFRVTNTWAPNFAFGLINDQASELAGQRWDLSCLRFILNGGEAIVCKTARGFLELLTPFGLPATAMHPAWGMSETSSGVTFSQRFTLATTSDADSFVEVGAPIPGAAVRVVDARDELLAEGEIGRLQVRGLPVTAAYYQHPQLNAEVFTADGWFNTGDLGRLRAGCLTITGREKDVIIVNGINFYSHEIEAVVEELEGVEVSFTAACPIRRAGEDTDRLAIFFHPLADADLPALQRAIRGQVLQKIGLNPDYLVPLPKGAIPKTAIGKIQRPQLRARLEAGAFESLLEATPPDALPDWFYARRWRPEPGTGGGPPAAGTVVIFQDAEGLAERLADQLRARRTIRVERGEHFAELGPDRFQIAPGKDEDYRRVLADLDIETVIHLWTYTADEPEPTSVAALEAAQQPGTFSLLFLLQTLAARTAPREVKLIVGSTGCQAAAATDRVAYAKTPLLGVLRTAPHEFETIRVQHVDFARAEPERDAACLVHEVSAPSSALEVAWREGIRLIPALEKISLQSALPGPEPIKPGGIYVITGGLGGLGVLVAEYLLQNFRARLLLLGRSPLPPESDWPRLLAAGGPSAENLTRFARLRDLGGEVMYASADVSDEGGLRAAVTRACAQWQGSLDGIFHLAGKYERRALALETPGSLAETFRAKVYGAWCLHRLATEHPGLLFINFSSSVSLVGGYLIGAYTAANSFLDGLSHFQRTHCSLRSQSLLWSLWRGHGMSAGFEGADTVASSGFLEIGAREGLKSLAFALRSGESELLIGIEPAKNNFCGQSDFQPDRAPAAASDADHIAPRTPTEKRLAALWEELLKRSPLGVSDNFFELGGKSLLAARLFSKIEQTFGHSLAISTLFRAPTIEQLAALLDAEEHASVCNLVPLETAGSLPPFFCIPGGGSDAIVFRDLAQSLGSNQPFYGLQARGLDATKVEGHLSVEETARAFVQKIRTIQPHGPYFLGGHCFGCVLAFEMAQQLARAGDAVPVLVLLDPIVSDSLSLGILGTDRLTYHFRKFMHLPLAGKWEYLATRIRNFSRTLIVRRRIRGSYEQAAAMHRDYELKPYPGKFACVLAADSFHSINPQRDPRRSWSRLGTTVDYLEVNGDHHTMLHEPAVQELAEKLADYISRSTAQPEAAPALL